MRYASFLVIICLVTSCSKQEKSEPSPTSNDEQAEKQQSQIKKTALQIRASFKDLPSGALIVAPVALDRRYQKITKTEHIIEPKQKGFSGVPERSADKENLIFVSGALDAKAATYTANYEVEVRSMKPGVFDSIEGQPYGQFNDPKLKAVFEAVSTPAKIPHEVVSKAFEATKGESGGDALTLASKFVSSLTEGGVPVRLVQGIYFDGAEAKPHIWAEALLPQLGWAPFDPFLAREAKGGAVDYRGQHPPDRIRVLFGETFVIPKKNKRAEFTVRSPFLTPQAIIFNEDGTTKAVAGEVSFTVSDL